MPGLNVAQKTELDRLSDVIRGIVAEGTLNRLQATRVLEGPMQGRADYQSFADRFALLHTRLCELRALEKVVVNPKLPASMGANTRIGVVDNRLVVVDLELGPSMLVDNLSTRTARAITLIHELAHAVGEDEGLLIRDYTYRSSWAWGYLPDPVSWRNADAYAEAAAQLAGQMEQVPDRFLRSGPTVARREALRNRPKLPLCWALAWADIKVNRAWLRSNDYHSYAERTSIPREWAGQLDGFKRDPFLNGLPELEEKLQEAKILGARYGFFDWGLSKEDVITAQLIFPWLTKLKDNLGAAIPQLTSQGTTVTFDADSTVLSIPLSLSDFSYKVLGEMIIDAVAARIDPCSAVLTANRPGLVAIFANHDRTLECEQLNPLAEFMRVESSGTWVSPDQWQFAQVELEMATLKGIGQEIGQAARQIHEQEPIELAQKINSLQRFLMMNIGLACATADRVLHGPRGSELAGSIRDHFGVIDAGMDAMAKAVVSAIPTQPLKIDNLRQQIARFGAVSHV